MDQIQEFNFNGLELHALLLDGEPWFVGADVARALEYRTASDMFRGVDDEDKGYAKVRTPGGDQRMITVNESGLYTAIVRANTERAKPFRRWVTNDVLPAIRKTGAYELPKTLEERSLALIGELTAAIQAKEIELQEARPKVEIYDKVLTQEHTFGFRDLCKTLREHFPINEADIRRLLREKKILTTSDRLDVYSHAVDTGWAVRRPQGTWGGKERFSPRFTNKTLQWLLTELAPLEDAS